MNMNKPMILVNRFTYGSAFLIIIAGVLIPLICGLIFKLHHIHSDEKLILPVIFLVVLLISVAPFLLVVYILRKTRISDKMILFLLLGFIFFTRLVVALGVDNAPVSDFLTMWNYVSSIANTGNFLSPEKIQEVRTLPYLLPVTLLFQGSPLGFKLANSLIVTLSGLLVYYLTYWLLNRRAGLVALSLFAFTPETLFSVTIPTHNIPGAFYLLLSIVLAVKIMTAFNRLTDNPKMYLFNLSILLGLSIALADLQRNIGIFLMASILLVTVILISEPDQKPGAIRSKITLMLYILIIPYVILFSTNYLIQKHVASDTYSNRSGGYYFNWLAAHANTESLGNYTTYHKLKPYLDQFSSSELKEFAVHKSLSDLYHHFSQRPVTYLKKAMILYHIGRQYDEYYGDLKEENEHLKNGLYELFTLYNEVFSVIFLALSIMAVFVLILTRSNSALLLPLVFLGILSFALLLLGEVQSSYVFPAWMILSLYIGNLAFMVDNRVFDLNVRTNLANFGVALGFSSLAVVMVLSALLGWYGLERGKLFYTTDWNPKQNGDHAGAFSVLLEKASSNPSGQQFLQKEIDVNEDSAYDFLFFSKPFSKASVKCVYSLQVKIGLMTLNKEIASTADEPWLWRLEKNVIGNGRIHIEIRLMDMDQSHQATQECDGVYIEYARLQRVNVAS